MVRPSTTCCGEGSSPSRRLILQNRLNRMERATLVLARSHRNTPLGSEDLVPNQWRTSPELILGAARSGLGLGFGLWQMVERLRRRALRGSLPGGWLAGAAESPRASSMTVTRGSSDAKTRTRPAADRARHKSLHRRALPLAAGQPALPVFALSHHPGPLNPNFPGSSSRKGREQAGLSPGAHAGVLATVPGRRRGG
jgi:hypothetical protein